MFNFTHNHSNAPLDTHEQVEGVSEKYDAAIKKIEQLEAELNQKTAELRLSCKAQSIMSEGVKSCAVLLCSVQNQLQTVAAHLNKTNKHIFELMQKNKALQSSGEEWFRRAIKLEFDMLTIKDRLTKAENERDLAIKMCELLRVELIPADKENSQDRK
ncbi:MAG: hypothetical protein QX198_07720 [Methylococcaceae bacterium]